MKLWLKGFGWFVVVVFTVTLLASVVTGSSILFYRTWAPMQENVERQVFEQTQSYRQGTIRDLRNLQIEYVQAETDAARRVLRETILHRAADFDPDDLPQELRSFVTELREEKANE